MDVLSHLGDEWRSVTHEPVLFLSSVLAVGIVAFVIASFANRVVISSLKSRIELKDEKIKDYEDKLSGASPEEAKARFDALEQRIARLAARRLSRGQRDQIMLAAINNAAIISVAFDMAGADAKSYAADIANAFSNGGWTVQLRELMNPPNPGAIGLAVRVRDAPDMEPGARAVLEAFNRAEIEYDLQRVEPSSATGEVVAAEILITTRSD